MDNLSPYELAQRCFMQRERKNDVFYIVGDDGELVEVDRETIERDDLSSDTERSIEPPDK